MRIYIQYPKQNMNKNNLKNVEQYSNVCKNKSIALLKLIIGQIY